MQENNKTSPIKNSIVVRYNQLNRWIGHLFSIGISLAYVILTFNSVFEFNYGIFTTILLLTVFGSLVTEIKNRKFGFVINKNGLLLKSNKIINWDKTLKIETKSENTVIPRGTRDYMIIHIENNEELVLELNQLNFSPSKIIELIEQYYSYSKSKNYQLKE